MQAEKRRQKLDDIRALKQKEGAPKLLAVLPLDEEPEKELAPVARNSICWGTFMATSANLRYQLLNGFEERYLVSCTRSFESGLCCVILKSGIRWGTVMTGICQSAKQLLNGLKER